ncbi:MAG: hypothetical protein FJX54_24560 [Alphaproteobacteria bacterium]|nr:hypothetical protein [Alphaproteobacteria bacterium]
MARLMDQIAPADRVVWRSAKRLIRRRGPDARHVAANASHALAFEGDECESAWNIDPVLGVIGVEY